MTLLPRKETVAPTWGRPQAARNMDSPVSMPSDQEMEGYPEGGGPGRCGQRSGAIHVQSRPPPAPAICVVVNAARPFNLRGFSQSVLDSCARKLRPTRVRRVSVLASG
jgi:hypothetical protein